MQISKLAESVLEMQTPKLILLLLLISISLAFAVAWTISLRRRNDVRLPSAAQSVIGFITDFFDTLGVGSFATTTSMYRFAKLVDDDKIPGTLNVGHCLPTILQALIYISIIKIDLWTLWFLILASVAGSYVGASLVSRLPKRWVQLGMGLALLMASILIVGKLTGQLPSGGQALALHGISLIIGLVGNFVFGALMTIGVGAYAPIMVMVSLLGMNPSSAFPLMMGSCAFLMPVASYRFVQSGKYDARAALGLTLFGLPAVAIAAWIVKKLDEEASYYIGWLVLVVVVYTAGSLLYAAWSASRSPMAAKTKNGDRK